MVVTIIWGLNCLIKNVIFIVIIIIVAPLLCFWNVYPMQGCDDILPQTFCHNSFSGAPSFNIQNAIIGVWSFIIIFTHKSNCCLNNGSFPLSILTCGRVFNRWPKMVHGNCHSFHPTSTLGIRGFGCHRYCLIGTWSESKSPSIDFLSLIALTFRTSRTWICNFGCTCVGDCMWAHT